MIPLRFTLEDADRANDKWGANCGPGAIAAIMGMTLDELRPHMGDFEQKHYTNPTLMWQILDRIGAVWKLAKPVKNFPSYGLARVQWHGPWTAPGVPPRVAYRHTHWIAAQWSESKQEFGIFDINCMRSGGWVALSDWQDIIVPWLLKECVPKASGTFHLTHVVEIDRDAINTSRSP
jgi:hypothetical protein